MGKQTVESFPKATVDYNEPTYGVGPSSQIAIIALVGLKSFAIGPLIAQEDGDDVEQLVYYVCRTLKDTETCYP